MSDTKKCPYCGEEIKTVAVKCKYCGSWLNDSTNEPIDDKKNNSTEASNFTLHKKTLIFGLMSLLGLILIVCGQNRYMFILDTIGVITYLGGWFLLSFGASKMALEMSKNANKVKHGIVVSGLSVCLIAIAASAFGLGEMIGGYECFLYLYPFAITFGITALILMIFEHTK